jgi:hypothetical protein
VTTAVCDHSHLRVRVSSVAAHVRTMQKLRADVLAACINCMNEDQQEFLHNQLLPVRRTIHHNMLLFYNWHMLPAECEQQQPTDGVLR